MRTLNLPWAEPRQKWSGPELCASRVLVPQGAGQNHARIQFHLGIMYATGQGVPRDDALSLIWIGKEHAWETRGARLAGHEAMAAEPR